MFFKKILASFPQNAGDLKKGLCPKIRKFSAKFKRQIFFCKFSCLLQDETTLPMTLAHFQQLKNSAVLEPRTGHFRGFTVFEAKSKDLTFDAMATDFKLCPRGLHLCCDFLFLGEGHIIKTLYNSSLEPNFTDDRLLLINIFVNTQTITTKICQCMEALECIFFMQKKGCVENGHLQSFASYETNCCYQEYKLSHTIAQSVGQKTFANVSISYTPGMCYLALIKIGRTYPEHNKSKRWQKVFCPASNTAVLYFNLFYFFSTGETLDDKTSPG